MTIFKPKTDLSNILARIDGGVAAAMVSSGVGSFVLGLMTTASEANNKVASLLNWWQPVGPLAGKTGVAVIAWLACWLSLGRLWRGREFSLKTAFSVTLALIGLGFLLTFPPFFGLFE